MRGSGSKMVLAAALSTMLVSGCAERDRAALDTTASATPVPAQAATATGPDTGSIVVMAADTGALRTIAATSLQCALGQVTFAQTGSSAGAVMYEAKGCGRSATYSVAKGAQTVGCQCIRHCPVPPGSPGGGTTCCEWKCDPPPKPPKDS